MEKIFEVLSELRPEFDFRESSNYIKDGMLDSFDIIALVSELETIYQINIAGTDILPEKFSDAEAIASVVRKNGGHL
jgi:acyl carrier protein